MKTLSPVILAISLILVFTIGAVQFLMIERISTLERERLQNVADSGAMNLAQDLDSELNRLFRVFLDCDPSLPDESLLNQLKTRYELLKTFSNPRLLTRTYVVHDANPLSWRSYSPEVGILKSKPLDFTAENGNIAVIDKALALIIPVEKGKIVLLTDRIQLGTNLSTLGEKYFGSSNRKDFHFAIVHKSGLQEFFYQSDPLISTDILESHDASSDIFCIHSKKLFLEITETVKGGEKHSEKNYKWAVEQKPTPGESDWRLVVKHKSGSLNAVVRKLQTQNRLLSAGILMLLAAAFVILLISARQAHRIAEQQMKFVAGVSHELRTPLTVIRSASENLADAVVQDPGRIRQYGSVIRDQGRRLTDMIDQLLEYAGIQSGKKSVVRTLIPVPELIEKTLTDFPEFQSGEWKITKDIPNHLPRINTDPEAMRTVLKNLLENARKYSKEKKEILVQAKEASNGTGRQIQITIQDQGIGIPDEDRPHIFEPFYRARTSIENGIHGSGLGLSLVKSIVESNGGSIQVESAPGYGSTFQVLLPAEDA